MSPDASADAPSGWVYRSEEPASTPAARPAASTPAATPRPAASSPATLSAGWIERGVRFMTTPVAITVGVMLAPIVWMFTARPRR